MIDLKLTDDGGLDLETPIDDTEQIKQGIRILLETQLGEFIEDKEMGLDVENILGEPYNELVIRSAVQEALKQDKQINRFDSFQVSIDRDHRSVFVNLKLYINENEYEDMEVELGAK